MKLIIWLRKFEWFRRIYYWYLSRESKIQVDISIDYKEGDIDLSWMCGLGFGHLAFYKGEDGKIYCNNECMSKEFCKRVLCALVDKSEMTE